MPNNQPLNNSKLKSHSIYKWDVFSDQPEIIKNKTAKRQLYRLGAIGSIKTFLAALLVTPLAFFIFLLGKRTLKHSKINNIGLCINIDQPLPSKAAVTSSQLQQLTEELGVDNLLIRLPLADIENLQTHIDFIKTFKNKNLLINILQDRRHIENPSLLHTSLKNIFTALDGTCSTYQIGNAVNRRKWAFISLDEYFNFFHTAQHLQQQEFPHIKLIGASIIDFELPNFVRSLFHLQPIKYNATAALLYVDRRGAPENTQMGCDLISKINWFSTLTRLSSKTGNELWITETNWPLESTEPFAPAVGECMVSEQLQAAYLARYYLLMFASGKVTLCYWHQLIAPGYGLIDNREQQHKKRKAFYAFKLLIQLFNNAEVTDYVENKKTGLYQLTVKNSQGSVLAVWANGAALNYTLGDHKQIIDITGNAVTADKNKQIFIDDNVSYILDYNLI